MQWSMLKKQLAIKFTVTEEIYKIQYKSIFVSFSDCIKWLNVSDSLEEISDSLFPNSGSTDKLEEIWKDTIATLLLWRHPHELLFGRLDKIAVIFSEYTFGRLDKFVVAYYEIFV